MEFLSLDEIKNIELDLLVQFDDFCSKYDLKYSLAYGTLLGAIRHKDFIPWDDDVDVMMPRKDYEKLFELLCQNHLKMADYISVLTSKDEGYYYHFNKIYNNKTIAKMDNNITYHGVWLDIFPVDNMPNSRVLSLLFHIKARFLRNLIIAATTDFTERNNKKYYIKLILKKITNITGIQNVSDYLSRYVQKYNNKKSKRVSIVHGQYSTSADLSYDKYFETERKIFRGRYFEVSKYWDELLRGLYGDYMVIPKHDNQVSHYLKASYKEEKER